MATPKRLPCDVCSSQARYFIKGNWKGARINRSCGRHLTGFVDTVAHRRVGQTPRPVTVTPLGG